MPMAQRRSQWFAPLALLLLCLSLAACTGESEPAVHTEAETPASVTVGAAATSAPADPPQVTSAAVLPSAAAPATAPPAKQQPTLALIGRLKLPFARGSVRVLGQYAFVGAAGFANCPDGGVAIVDIGDPAQPRLAATAVRAPGASTEDVAVLRLNTPAFSGDLLAAGLQRCNLNGPAGLALVDVSDPANPVDLAIFPTPTASRGVHELDLLAQADGRVLALLAAPGSERAGVGDLQIVDVTDPRRPVLIASWGAGQALGIPVGAVRTGLCGVSGAYAHSVRAGAAGRRAYVSSFDAGVLLLDISDPTAPRLLSRIFQPDSPDFFEGAFHSAVEGPDGTLLVAQEIGYPFGPGPGMLIRAEGGGQSLDAPACVQEGRNTVPEPVSGPLSVLASCDGSLAEARGRVLLAPAGCDLPPLVAQAQRSGVTALVLTDTPDPFAGATIRSLDTPMPRVWVSAASAERLAALAQTAETAVTIPVQRRVGGVSVWDIRDPANPAPLSTFHTANAERFPPPDGIYSAHEPVVIGRLAAISWYRDGVRLLDLSAPRRPVEIAAWAGEPGADLAGWWGVAVAGDLILGSDFNGELWVLRASGVE